jgi:hypothetical protein
MTMMMKTAMLTAALVLTAPGFACAQDDAEAAFKQSDKKLNKALQANQGPTDGGCRYQEAVGCSTARLGRLS